MKAVKIQIKDIRSTECPDKLLELFKHLGAEVDDFDMGVLSVTMPSHLSLSSIDRELKKAGFIWVRDKHIQLVEQVKYLVFTMLNDEAFKKSRLNVSTYLSDRLGRSYPHISRVFSKVESCTLEKYIIEQRIEITKEYLYYGTYSLVEVANKLGYSSVQHLSRQFHEVTGMTTRTFLHETSLADQPKESSEQVLEDQKKITHGK